MSPAWDTFVQLWLHGGLAVPPAVGWGLGLLAAGSYLWQIRRLAAGTFGRITAATRAHLRWVALVWQTRGLPPQWRSNHALEHAVLTTRRFSGEGLQGAAYPEGFVITAPVAPDYFLRMLRAGREWLHRRPLVRVSPYCGACTYPQQLMAVAWVVSVPGWSGWLPACLALSVAVIGSWALGLLWQWAWTTRPRPEGVHPIRVWMRPIPRSRYMEFWVATASGWEAPTEPRAPSPTTPPRLEAP